MIKAPSTQATVAPVSDVAPFHEGTALLDAEKLDVYQVALEYHALAKVLTARADAVLRDQLRRASLSSVLNIAEGAGQRSRPQKRNHYGIARGSAMECAAIVDALRAGDLVTIEDARTGRSLLVRLIQMLTKLERSMR
jgi:four helix bundle protein